MNRDLLREEVRKIILENWSSEILAMLRSEFDSKNSKFVKWWNSSPPINQRRFLQRQFKLSASAADQIIKSLALEGSVNEFGERLVGKYRGSLDAFMQASYQTGTSSLKGYKARSVPYSDKSKAVSMAKRLAKSDNLDTMAVQDRQDGKWRVYGKPSGNSKFTPKYF